VLLLLEGTLFKQYTTAATPALSSSQPGNQAASPALAARRTTLLKQYTTASKPALLSMQIR
jgi:hypothetical protein